jgi:hypothetical protein
VEKKLMLEVDAANLEIVAETEVEMKAVEICMSDIQDISHKFDYQNSRSKYFYASLYAICTRIPCDFTFLLLFSNLTSSIDQIFNFRCEIFKHGGDICCKSYIADEHRTCGKIKPLDVVAKGVKNATMFEDFASEVEYLIDTASKIREQKQTACTMFVCYA